VFENPASAENLRLVDGPELGKLLVESDAPVLVLNACRSAYADILSSPATTPEVLCKELMKAGGAAMSVRW
jgi:Tat protein secretion system quality control protein TatD with DNase activity